MASLLEGLKPTKLLCTGISSTEKRRRALAGERWRVSADRSVCPASIHEP